MANPPVSQGAPWNGIPPVGVSANAAVNPPIANVQVGVAPNAALITPRVANERAGVAANASMFNDNRPDPWRYRHENGRWWYWAPDNRWMIYDNNQWTNYQASTVAPAVATPAPRLRPRPAIRPTMAGTTTLPAIVTAPTIPALTAATTAAGVMAAATAAGEDMAVATAAKIQIVTLRAAVGFSTAAFLCRGEKLGTPRHRRHGEPPPAVLDLRRSHALSFCKSIQENRHVFAV